MTTLNMSRLSITLVLVVPTLAAQDDAAAFPALVAAYEKAAAAEGPEAAAKDVLPRFLAAAARHKGKDAAIPFLQWVLTHGGVEETAITALDALLDDHLKNPEIVAVADYLPCLATYLPEPAGQALARIIEGNQHPEVQAQALFGRASLTFALPGADDGRMRAARDDLAMVLKLTKQEGLAARAKAMAKDGRGLRIGDVAPEIAGFDLDGAPLRLSDHRGKVVVLDFWGDW